MISPVGKEMFLALWNLKECWDGSFSDNNQECPVWSPPDNPCFDLRLPIGICRGSEINIVDFYSIFWM